MSKHLVPCPHHPNITTVWRRYELDRLVEVETQPCWRCASFIRFNDSIRVSYRLIIAFVVGYLIVASLGRWI